MPVSMKVTHFFLTLLITGFQHTFNPYSTLTQARIGAYIFSRSQSICTG